VPQKQSCGNQLFHTRLTKKINRQRVKIRQEGSQLWWIDGVWSWDGEGGMEKRNGERNPNGYQAFEE